MGCSMETIVVIPARGGSVRIPLKNLQMVGGLPLEARAIRLARASPRIGGVIVSTDHPEIAAVARAEGAEVVHRPAEISGDQSPVEAALLHVLESLAARGAAPGPARFLEAGSVYATRVGGFLQSRSLLFGKTALHPIDPARLLRIETLADLYRARQLAGETPLPRQEHAVIYVDVDETICINQPDRDYRRAVPIPENVTAVNRLYDRGHTIVYWTARGGHSGIDYAELTRAQLDGWGARYHRLVMGKPSYDLLICDKATRSIPAV